MFVEFPQGLCRDDRRRRKFLHFVFNDPFGTLYAVDAVGRVI